jgi:hypothetical protein
VGKLLLEPAAYFFGLVAEWPHATFVYDSAGFIDDVKPFGPSGIEPIRGIRHGVDSERDGIVEPPSEVVRDSDTVLK